MLGATALVIGAVQTFLACTYHGPEVVSAAVAPDPAPAGVPVAAR